MRKKEAWMKKGNLCYCDGKLAKISKFQENTATGYVFNFWVSFIEGKNGVTGPYHPSDIKEYYKP